MSIANSFNQVLNARPFETLGIFKHPQGWFIRVFFAQANAVQILSFDGQTDYGSMEQVDSLGLFEFVLKQAEKPVYKLRITHDDHQWHQLDAYQFTERSLEDFEYDYDTLYKNLGAQLCDAKTKIGPISGVRFAVYAPNARSVSVIGDFNNWDGRRNPLQSNDDGIWRLFIPELNAGTHYKFEIKNQHEERLPHKSDPYNFYCTQHPDFNSVVVDHSQYTWKDQDWQQRPYQSPYQNPMNIYEIHAGSWKRNAHGELMNFRELANELVPYLKNMHYTHIEFMPITEHPFDGSWGYQPLGLFAPTSRYGTPDDFKYLVDTCHQANIAVIIDWVPAHFPSDAHGLAKFDGSALYEYEDPRRGWHPDWNSFIYDYGKWMTRDFLISSALIWLDYYHIDGLRVDAVASMLYLDYSRENQDWVPNVDGGNHNYEAIALLKRFNETVYKRYPNAITIAEESTAFSGVTQPVHHGGLGFGFKWNMGWMNDSLEYMKRDPIYRQYHHNEMTFSAVYSFTENFILPLSHDEVVHGKGSILSRMPGDEWQSMANLRAYHGFMFGHPGKKLNFMGNEIGQGVEWSHTGQLDWYLLQYERHQGMQLLMQDLNCLYLNEPALYELDCEGAGFRWINHEDAAVSVFSFLRFSIQGEIIAVVSNFTPSPFTNYRIGVPKNGYYQVILNTDSHFYHGSNFEVGNGFLSFEQEANHLPYAIEIAIPPLATIFLKYTEIQQPN